MPVFIINPKSRSGTTSKNLAFYKSVISKRFPNAEILLTQRRRHAEEIAREALKKGAALVVAVGGDGTANEVLNGFFDGDRLVSQDASFATLMCGTGCDFRRTLGFPKDFEGQLDRIKRGKAQLIDVGRVHSDNAGEASSRYFLNEASVGLSAEVAKQVWEKKGKRNKLAYLLKALSSLGRHPPVNLRVQTDDGERKLNEVSFIAFMNGSYFGGGMQVAPDARIDDGLGEIICISNISFRMALRNALKIYRGTHLSIPEVLHFKSRAITIEKPQEIDVLVEMDGEPFGKLPATLEIKPSVLKLIR